jgi:putative endonuclease
MNTGNYYVYIATNPRKSVLYTGITNNIKKRETEHFENRGNGQTFAWRYYCYKILYYEHFSDIKQAIFREKEIKKMSRLNKLRLIKTKNPFLEFLVVDNV